MISAKSALYALRKDITNRSKLNFPRFEIVDIIDKHIKTIERKEGAQADGENRSWSFFEERRKKE